jgi:LuxR family quorum sensing-dependent transcriptional regulator
MARRARGFGQQALDFIEEVGRLDHPGAVVEATHRVISRLGFDWFVFTGLVPEPGQDFDELVLAGRFPGEFREAYARRDYMRFDPNVSRALNSSSPFEWAVADYDNRHGSRVGEVMRFFTEFDIRGGFIVPIHGPSGQEAGVAYAGTKFELSSSTKPMVHLMTLYAFDRLRELVAERKPERTPLTAREREVLAWSAQGKSAWEIGEILSVAKRTVDEHAQTAMRKLGATNRTQAVAIALRHRLFEL